MMEAIILVGGEGTRLRPLTFATPKAMAPILNRPFLEHMLVYARGHGITTVRLALGHQPDAIRAYFGDGGRCGVALSATVEEHPLGSGGAIKQFEAQLSEPFFAFNGDILTNIDLGAMAERHRRSNADVSIALIEVDDPSGFGVVRLGEEDRIEAFVEKPPPSEAPSRWANAGVWLFQPEVLAAIPAGRRSMVETELFPQLIAAGRRVQGFCTRAFWVDIGTPQRYLEAQLRLLREPALRVLPLRTLDGGTSGTTLLSAEDDDAPPPRIDRIAELTGPIVLGAAASIGAGARVIGPAVLGRGASVAAGATLDGSVLWEGARIEAGALVQGSVLANGASVGAGARLNRAVLGHDAAARAGLTLHDARVDPPGKQ
jgi:mannose-1-phosphate guanylyltransferase